MILQHQPPLHLTYCLNIHPGESWAENFTAIKEKALAVKQRVAADQYFGLGLRLSQFAAAELASNPALVDEAREFFAEHQMYPFSINGFPYGRFHAGPVKEKVYAPDWRTPERRDYTMLLADIFTNFLPPEVDGSISTVPCSFKPWILQDEDRVTMAHHLAAVVAYLAAIREDTGQEMHIGLEPEPDCYLETCSEMIAFFNDTMLLSGVDEVARIMGCTRPQAEVAMRCHLGVCLDTCHAALQFENPLESLRAYRGEGIRISKIQLSAALAAPGGPETWEAFKPFAEPVYLHQVKATTKDGPRLAWYDLPTALEEGPAFPDIDEVRVHFHVPLFFQKSGPLGSTVSTLTPDFFHELREGACAHLEIETYTFDVLPETMRGDDVVKSIAREYAWVLGQLH
jgi:hypothetical protein